jgi:2-iminoacetate synthase
MSRPEDLIRPDDEEIERLLARPKRPDSAQVRDVLAKAREARGLTRGEVSVLFGISDPELLAELFAAARAVKDRIYGKRLVLFAPLYISNLCENECVYCAFRARNKAIRRRALTCGEIAKETLALVCQGHKRVLVVAGESYPRSGLDYVLEAIDAVYSVCCGPGEIRRVNVNIAPLSVEEFRRLKEHRIGTYQMFQETYHRPTYEKMHIAGRKRDFDWRLGTMDRALSAGVNDVGIGVLFGLFDWRYEVLAMLQQIERLERRHGVGPHTISVPRLEPATGSDVSIRPPCPVSDVDFRMIVAILRLAVPYTGIIMSTRETAKVRRETFALGVSQISAGSRTNPGGYSSEDASEAQFSLGDHRPLDEVIRDIAALGYIPSFCTACYRLGRTGRDFMDLARPGDIRAHCDPNALGTFLEYLLDYASPGTRLVGEAAIAARLDEFEAGDQARAVRIILEEIRGGRRDVFV